MKLLTEDAVITCNHILGRVSLEPGQTLVRINHRRILVEDDPERKKITGCPNIGATIKPCQLTLRVQSGYSDLLRIKGHRICLDTVTGLTDGTPPGAVHYQVRQPGQTLIDQKG